MKKYRKCPALELCQFPGENERAVVVSCSLLDQPDNKKKAYKHIYRLCIPALKDYHLIMKYA